MDEGKGWFRANWRTAAVLVLIFGLALFLRVYFVYGLAFQLPHVNCDSIYTPTYSAGLQVNSAWAATTPELSSAAA